MAVLEELPAGLRDAMRREVNHGLMVAYINADLFNRAGLDVRKSIVLYDDAGVFEAAVGAMPNEKIQQALIDQTSVRYYSKGIV